ncbi:9630_t:CDS:2, partial [Racocetra fulgida]
MNPARNPIDNSTVELKLEYHFNEVKEQYHELATIVKNSNDLYQLMNIYISAPENSQSRELEERLKLMLEIRDPDILVDLRINNGFKDSMSSLSEETFASLKTLEEIHNEAENFLSLKNELQNSISNIQALLNIRTEYLKLYDNTFITRSPATNSDINELFN